MAVLRCWKDARRGNQVAPRPPPSPPCVWGLVVPSCPARASALRVAGVASACNSPDRVLHLEAHDLTQPPCPHRLPAGSQGPSERGPEGKVWLIGTLRLWS